MRIRALIAGLLGLCTQVNGKAVFAHFMVCWFPIYYPSTELTLEIIS